MRLAGFAVKSLTDDLPMRHDHRTGGRIRAGQTDTALRLIEREMHPPLVGCFVLVLRRWHVNGDDKRVGSIEKQ
jgi:hypothetical protein